MLMRRIYVSHDSMIIGHARQVLENNAIRCIVRNDFLLGGAGELPVNETWPELWVVDDGEFERARALIDALVETATASAIPWDCGFCGERIEGQFTDCWACGASRPASDG